LHWLLMQWHEHDEEDRKGTEKTGEINAKEGKAESLLFQLTKGRVLCDLVVKMMVEGAIQRSPHNPS